MRTHDESKKVVGVLGTGLVGSALSLVLLENGFEVHIWNRTYEKTEPLVKKGAIPENSPCDIGKVCERVLISVMTTDNVVTLCEGQNGLLSADPSPCFILDTTTGDPEDTIALSKRLASRGVFYLDTPISGSSRQIRERKGVFMVGCEREAFEKNEDILLTLAEKVFYLGPPGSGSKAKLATNLVLGLNRLAFAEGLAFAESLGLNARQFFHLIRETPAYSAAMDVKGEKMLKRDFSPESKVVQHYKDLEIIRKYAQQGGKVLPLMEAHRSLLEKMLQEGLGELDNAAVYKYLSEMGKKE
ncbi:MAG: NAD(P)-dependent oxidoreductase [Spirochaetales bacterium]|nr:NAD(P)-dependent oxidoreductase [Spirochaetales bacterium]